MSQETNATELKSVKVTDSRATAGTEFNPLSVFTEREKIALTSRWAALKDAERDDLVEYAAQGLDSATLYAIYSLKQEASTKIFSDMRASYVLTLLSNYMTLTSKEDVLRKFAEQQLETLKDTCTGGQLATLLSALKAKLLDKRTFMPEQMESGFRAVCRFYGFDKNMIK
jgi:hypothetical protein